MTKRLLAVDVGNTQTTLGLFEGASLQQRWSMATRVARTGDEIWVFLRQFFAASDVDMTALDGVSISSVVPELTAAYVQMASERLAVRPFVITAERVRRLTISYSPPNSVGADRLCGAVAAFVRFGGPAVVVDLGTATVFDVVSKDGVYLGGLIAPGLVAAAESLHRTAALLPRAELRFPEKVIGQTTETAIQSGILWGAVAMIDGVVERIRAVVGGPIAVVATGGFAELLLARSAAIQHVEPNLVLEGIRIITDDQ